MVCRFFFIGAVPSLHRRLAEETDLSFCGVPYYESRFLRLFERTACGAVCRIAVYWYTFTVYRYTSVNYDL